MQKTILWLGIALIPLACFGFKSEEVTLLNETFDGNWNSETPPPGWTITLEKSLGNLPDSAILDPWNKTSAASSASCAGSLLFLPNDPHYQYPTFYAYTQMTSPAFDCSKAKMLELNFQDSCSFKCGDWGFQDDWPMTMIEVSADDGKTWDTVYSYNDYYHPKAFGQNTIKLPALLEGKPSVRLRWTNFVQRGTDVWGAPRFVRSAWLIDNVCVKAFTDEQTVYEQDFNGDWSTGEPPQGWHISTEEEGGLSPYSNKPWDREDEESRSGCAVCIGSVSGKGQKFVSVLTSPAMDCSANRRVRLNYEDYFRFAIVEGTGKPYPVAQIAISVSGDGGSSWNCFCLWNWSDSRHEIFNRWIDNSFDLTEWAAGKKDVRIRWDFETSVETHYGKGAGGYYYLDYMKLLGY